MADDKKMPEERRFAILTRESMRMYGEAGGHADLPDDVTGMLGEDVSYRLRAIAQIGAQFMRHAKRRRLTTEDMNKAFRNMDVQPILGHGSLDRYDRLIQNGDIHFVEDHDVNFSNIATNSYIPKNTGNTSIKAHWLAVEGVPKQLTSHQQSQPSQNASQPGQPSQGKPPLKFGSKVVTEELLLYYDHMTKAILGCDEEIMKIALKDLRTNSKIVRLLPYFVNFVSNGVKRVSHDITQLTKLLHTVKSLTSNKYLYLEPKPYLSQLVQGVMYCVLEPLAASINPLNDHWVLRDYAARLLAQIISRWNSPINQLRQNTLRTLKDALYDFGKPFCSHYGAVMGLLALGCQSIEDSLIPHLSGYWPHLQTFMEDNCKTNALFKTDAHKVYGAILLAVELLIKKKLHEFESQCAKERIPVPLFNLSGMDGLVDSAKEDVPMGETPPDLRKPNVCEFYKQMYDYFGDDLAMRLPKLNLQRIFKPSKKEVFVSLRDQEMDNKSGEELLEEFMEQVRLQQIREEEERKKREELERLMAIERHKQMIKQRELQRVEQEKRQKEAEIRRRQEAELQRQRQEEMRLYEIERQKDLRRQQELERQQLEMEYRRQQDELSRRAIHQAMALERSQAAHGHRTSHNLSMASVEQECYVSDGEEEQDVDVEYTSDRSAESDVKSDDKSDKEEDAFYREDPSQMDLTVKTTVNDPQGGIKLTISKRPKTKISKHTEKTERSERGEKHKDKEYKHSKKRKQSQKSPRETQRSPRGDPDKYDLGDVKRKAEMVYQFDGGDHVSKPKSSYTKRPSHRDQDDLTGYERIEEERKHSHPRTVPTLKLSKSKLKEASAAQGSPNLS